VSRFKAAGLVGTLLALASLCACQRLVRDTQSLLFARFERSEVVGFVAGFGTTFAAVPDLMMMLKRRSSAGMNLRILTIMAAFQILWIYYGLLIRSRPVVAWNLIAVLMNLLTIGASRHFAQKGKTD
jgi:uncharacterized protein with PQ loop repeat